MTTSVRRILLVLTVVGLASSLASLYVHARLFSQPGYVSFCDVNDAVSCTQVYQSAYSTVWGIPVALFGSLWYVGVLVLLAGSAWGWSSLRENALAYIFLASVAGLGSVIYLAYASLVILKIVCAMCIVTYVAVAGVFLSSGARIRIPMTTLPRRIWQDFRTALASPPAMMVVLVFVIASTAAIAFSPRHPETAPAAAQPQAAPDKQSEFLRYWESQARVQVPVQTEGATVVIVKFSDYMCPACAQSYMDYKETLAKYKAQFPNDFKFIEKDYPLARQCNPNLQSDMHIAACEAAAAVHMARQKGRGEAMEDWLFARNQALTPAAVKQAARDIGGVADFDAQYASAINQVKTDVALASILGISRTPTFFIGHKEPGKDGLEFVRSEGALPLQYLELAIQYELKKAGKIVP